MKNPLRIMSVLLALPIAAYYGKTNPTCSPMGEGCYGIAMRKGDDEIRKKIDEVHETPVRKYPTERIVLALQTR